MRFHRAFLLGSLFLLALGCGKDANQSSGPITFVPVSYIIGTDTVHGKLTIDNAATYTVAKDSVIGFPRGQHSFVSQIDLEYLERHETLNIDPPGNRLDFLVPYAASCRSLDIAGNDCANHSAVSWSGSRRLYCHVNDFGEFCTGYSDPNFKGLRWPTDNQNTIGDAYVSNAKLLIAAKVGPELTGATGNLMAMGLYLPGDYGPRQRLTVAPGDSSRWTATAWTDLRHKAFEAFGQSFLDKTDRPKDLYGLEVKSTYYLPANQKDVLFVRFDVTNISNQPAYNLVHPEAPPSGFTTRNIYLTPTVDVSVGVPVLAETKDDNATLFPDDSLLVGYDQNFLVSSGFSGTTEVQPGMVGLRLISAPAGTIAKGLIAEIGDSLSYSTNAYEDDAYKMLAAGREGAPRTAAGCTDYTSAYVCAPETPNDVVMGWSIGPIAQLAPGETTSLTIAILMAYPQPGTFTSGSSVPPQNDQLTSTSRSIYSIAAPLRSLSSMIGGTPVTPVR